MGINNNCVILQPRILHWPILKPDIEIKHNLKMKREIDPHKTKRSEAFDLWITSPMPMVTLTKRFDVSPIVKFSKRSGIKPNALICWCIGKAASQMEEFYLLPEQGKLFQYDHIAINVIVSNCKGGLSSCDISFNEDIRQFYNDYLTLTQRASAECASFFLEDCMIIGTSALIQTEIDSIINQYSDKFCNPMVMWGRFRKHWFKTELPISFQYHHVQMDGGNGSRFLMLLQKVITQLK